jgi:hypothetical protein
MKMVLAALLFLSALPLFAQFTPLKTAQHKAAHTIIMINQKDSKGAGCSATAVGEHVLLTATHCDIAGGVLYLDQTLHPFVHPLTVSEKIVDHQDHMLLVIPGVTFKNFVKLDLSVKSLHGGEHYYLWGNPGLIADQYREGYVTGEVIPVDQTQKIDVFSPFVMLSGPVVGGDSGSGIYGEDGRLCGVLTYGIYYGMFAGVYPITFTPEQLAQAEGHGTFVYGPTTDPVVVVLHEEKAAPAVKTCFLNLLVFLLSAALLIYIIPPVVTTVKSILRSFGRAVLCVTRLRICSAQEVVIMDFVIPAVIIVAIVSFLLILTRLI